MYGWQREISNRVPEGPGPSVAKALARARKARDRAQAAVDALVAACPHLHVDRAVTSRARFDTLGNACGGYDAVACKVCGAVLLKVNR